jgi:polyphosphate kinase 2 (PPK2 family)
MAHKRSQKKFSLAKIFKAKNAPHLEEKKSEELIKKLQLEMLRIQQGVWHHRQRVIIVFEGFDAAGKGGAIRRLVESLDPRGFMVFPIGAPEEGEKGQHYLYRFWKKLPPPGHIAIFDRSWYGRVLVEKVEGLAPKPRLEAAYSEINEFENLLLADGIHMVKIFIAIDKKEQLRRFEDRLQDPYKQWKLTPDDVKARAHWKNYVKAAEEMFDRTSTKKSPWHLVAGNDKDYARVEVLRIVTSQLASHRKWIELQTAHRAKSVNIKKLLKELENGKASKK